MLNYLEDVEIRGSSPNMTRRGEWLQKIRKVIGKGFFGNQKSGAVEKTRTSMNCFTATSTLRVYQFRHDRIYSEETYK